LSYEQERDFEIHPPDDCQYRNGDSNGPRHHLVHGHVETENCYTATVLQLKKSAPPRTIHMVIAAGHYY